MTYAYRRTIDDRGRRSVDLFVSENGKNAPNGYMPCSAARFRRAWHQASR